MNTKLILVEGLPGSGKSTFAKMIADYYTARGVKTNLFQEGGFHPADLAWNAVIPLEELESVLAPYQSFRKEIDLHTTLEDGLAIVSYPQVKTENGDFFRDMEAHEVYDARVPFTVFSGLLRKRWSAFASRAVKKDELTIFECAFLQNHVSELMNFQLFSWEEMKWYFEQLLQTVRELSPFLVYLSEPDVEQALARTANQRVFEGGSWIDGMIQYQENTPYGKRNRRKGFEGVVRSFEERKRLELELIGSLPLDAVVLENPDCDWDALWKALECKLPK